MTTLQPEGELLAICRLLAASADGPASQTSYRSLEPLVLLYRCLADRGWAPPETVERLLRLNDQLVDLSLARLSAGTAAPPPDVPHGPATRRTPSTDET